MLEDTVLGRLHILYHLRERELFWQSGQGWDGGEHVQIQSQAQVTKYPHKLGNFPDTEEPALFLVGLKNVTDKGSGLRGWPYSSQVPQRLFLVLLVLGNCLPQSQAH